MFFFEKKNQKTFARCRGLLSSTGLGNGGLAAADT
jgi:hypothetical protein